MIRDPLFFDLRQPKQYRTAYKICAQIQGEERCIYCGTEGDLEIDHIHPKSLGGTDSIQNLVLACVPCNRKKMHHSVDQLIQRGPDLEELASKVHGLIHNRKFWNWVELYPFFLMGIIPAHIQEMTSVTGPSPELKKIEMDIEFNYYATSHFKIRPVIETPFSRWFKSSFSEKKKTKSGLLKENGYSWWSMDKWLKGISVPEPDRLNKIADYFETSRDFVQQLGKESYKIQVEARYVFYRKYKDKILALQESLKKKHKRNKNL